MKEKDTRNPIARSMDIWYSDLTPECQKKVLKFYEVGSPQDINASTFPITVLVKED